MQIAITNSPVGLPENALTGGRDLPSSGPKIWVTNLLTESRRKTTDFYLKNKLYARLIFNWV